MTPQEKLKEISNRMSLNMVSLQDQEWLFARVEQLDAALRQCRIYSECYEELIMTIDAALIEGPKTVSGDD